MKTWKSASAAPPSMRMRRSPTRISPVWQAAQVSPTSRPSGPVMRGSTAKPMGKASGLCFDGRSAGMKPRPAMCAGSRNRAVPSGCSSAFSTASGSNREPCGV